MNSDLRQVDCRIKTQAKLQRLLDAQDNPVAAFRQVLDEGTQHLFACYDEGARIDDLVLARSLLVDMLLREAWKRLMPSGAAAALVAVKRKSGRA